MTTQKEISNSIWRAVSNSLIEELESVVNERILRTDDPRHCFSIRHINHAQFINAATRDYILYKFRYP